MRRLALIRRTRLYPVTIADRDIQLFLQIPIEISKKNTKAAVRILEPTLIGRSHVLTELCKGSIGNCADCPLIGSVAHTSAEMASTIARYRGVTGDVSARIGEISSSW